MIDFSQKVTFEQVLQVRERVKITKENEFEADGTASEKLRSYLLWFGYEGSLQKTHVLRAWFPVCGSVER
jgi:hypothetical protein